MTATPHDTSAEDVFAIFMPDPAVEALDDDCLDPLLLRRAAISDNAELRVRAAEHPQLPPDLHAHLVDDPNRMVRVMLAAREDMAPPVYEVLASDPDDEVVTRVAANRAAPPGPVARRIVLSGRPRPERVLGWNAEEEVLRHVLRSRRAWATRLVAEHPRTPPDVLDRLANRVSADIRARVATNARVPVAVAERLARDADPWVRVVAAAYGPFAVTPMFTADDNEEVRLTVANRDPLPEDVRRTLSRDVSARVRKASLHPAGSFDLFGGRPRLLYLDEGDWHLTVNHNNVSAAVGLYGPFTPRVASARP